MYEREQLRRKKLSERMHEAPAASSYLATDQLNTVAGVKIENPKRFAKVIDIFRSGMGKLSRRKEEVYVRATFNLPDSDIEDLREIGRHYGVGVNAALHIAIVHYEGLHRIKNKKRGSELLTLRPDGTMYYFPSGLGL